MDVLRYTPGASPRDWGRQHGEVFRERVREIAQVRLELAREKSGFPSNQAVLDVAREHLPVLKAFSNDHYDELIGIAEGSGTTPELIVASNHYTDLRDLGPGVERIDQPDPGGCTVVWSRALAGPVLAMTWDTHATVIPYVMMLHVPEAVGPARVVPEAWLFTFTGCVGMAGLNAHGVAVVINNLFSLDGRVGIVWPALIREMLTKSSAAEAYALLGEAPIGSGHHYVVADQNDVFAMETSGRLKRPVFAGERDRYVHTNHCLDESIGACSRVSPTSSTYDRFALMGRYFAGDSPPDAEAIWRHLGSHDEYPRAICTHMASPAAPNGVATCGGILMGIEGRYVWAERGCLNDKSPRVFPFDSED